MFCIVQEDNYSVFLHWKNTIKILVKDAYMRKIRDDKEATKENQVDDVVNDIMSKWQSYFLR
jgi:hypothetical protein